MIRIVAFLLFASATAFAQKAAPPPSADFLEAKKAALEVLTAHKGEMAKLGYKAEMDDCDSCMRKILEFGKLMPEKGGGTPYPGDEAHEALLKSWGETGTKLSEIFKTAAEKLADAEKDEAEILSGWFGSWTEVGNGIRHLNRRRKFIKLTPVMADWSGTIGGYLHGRYLKLNAGHPSTAGLGAHKEDMKLKGYTLEGAAAAGGILGGGSGPYVMDSWLGSEYHREPVFSRNCSRVFFGGLPGGWWSCRNAGGGSGQALADVLTFPGNGDTDIVTYFGGEGPNPLEPFGMTESGTFVVVDFLKGRLKKPTPHLLTPEGKEVEIIVINKNNPISFVAKEPLQGETKYTVEIRGADGAKFTFSFTTAKAPEWKK